MKPIQSALEHDSANVSATGELPDPPTTEVTNSAIALFALGLPLQTPKVQEAILEQLAGFLKSPNFQRNPGRKAAVTVNTALALLAMLKVALGETTASSGDLRSPNVEKCLERLLTVSSSIFTHTIINLMHSRT